MAGPHELNSPTRRTVSPAAGLPSTGSHKKLSESRRRAPGRRDPPQCPDLSPDLSPDSSPDLSPDPDVGCGAQCDPRDHDGGDESLAAAAGGGGWMVSCADSRMAASCHRS
jgi:hypothetical protein